MKPDRSRFLGLAIIKVLGIVGLLLIVVTTHIQYGWYIFAAWTLYSIISFWSFVKKNS